MEIIPSETISKGTQVRAEYIIRSLHSSEEVLWYSIDCKYSYFITYLLEGIDMGIIPSETISKGTQVRAEYIIRSLHSSEEVLWYSIDCKYSYFITYLLDGPLVALLIPAMKKGEDHFVRGTILRQLYFNLITSFQKFLIRVIPSLKLINIFPDDIFPRKSDHLV
jgi:hypothetical protein